MKSVVLSLLTLLIANNVFAQKATPVLARVTYIYTNEIDTLKNGKPKTENMMLFLGKDASLYVSYSKIRAAINLDQKVRSIMPNTNKTTIKLDVSALDQANQTSYFAYPAANKYYIKETVDAQDFLIEEPEPKLNWKITKDTASFSGIGCQKAITNFEGKTWIAWFAPSLPFSSGPYKFHNLPGLVVEAYDEAKKITYRFGGIDNAKENTVKRLVDVTKKITSEPGDINPLDLMMGTDVANAYFDNTIKLPYSVIKTTKEKLNKFKSSLKEAEN
ncbi:MAG: GLPGLI family protein [Chitinophagaceae bacterium]|nr:MAG: GLPGLI family protein [Chitinophagaceae bacterium]